ncbi:MAG TPA: hypothetical protein VGE30_02725 [Candidatus Saccharimonadales bacterium]
MSLEERLYDFYPFDEAVITAVSDVAARHEGRLLREIAGGYGVSLHWHQDQPMSESIRVVEYLDMHGHEHASRDQANVLFTPLDASVRSRAVMQQALHLFGVDPTKRLLVVGGPPPLGIANTIRFGDMHKTWKGQLHDAVDPVLSLLKQKGIKDINVLGQQYGAELAAETAIKVHRQQNDRYPNVERVNAGVFIEPLAVKARSRGDIARAQQPIDPNESRFARAGKAASRYRFTNYVVSKAMGRDGFKDRLATALTAHPELRSTVVWSDSSDTTDPERLQDAVSELRANFSRSRVGAIALEGAHTADFKDSALLTAVMLQGLRNATAA